MLFFCCLQVVRAGPGSDKRGIIDALLGCTCRVKFKSRYARYKQDPLQRGEQRKTLASFDLQPTTFA